MSTATLDPEQGMRTLESIPTDQRPKDWLTVINQLDFAGEVPFLAMLGKLAKRTVTDPEFNWFDETITTQSYTGATGMVYVDSTLTTAYAGSDDVAVGTTVYVSVSASFIEEVVVGHVVLLQDADDHTNDIQAYVVSRNTANNSFACKTLIADGTGAGDMSNTDTVIIIGFANPELGQLPSGVSYDPTKLYNFTQIFTDALAMSGTELATILRTEEEYRRQKTLLFQRHMRGIERAIMFGERGLVTENGKPKRFTRGYITAIRTHTPGNVDNYRLSDTNYNGKTWIASDGGNEWLQEMLEKAALKGLSEKFCFMGVGAARGLTRLAENFPSVAINLNQGERNVVLGIKVRTVLTEMMTLHCVIHPMFNAVTSWRNSMLIFEPRQVRYCALRTRDTVYLPDPNRGKGGLANIDGLIEGFRTEAGLEYHHTDTAMYLEGVGIDNP